jgi:uncharacterized membrane protein
MYRLATVTPDGVHWILRRNCSVTPRQLGAMFALLSVLSLAVAAFFWSQGAWMVLPFSALELLAVAVAFLMYGRHAADGEYISLHQGRLVVELEQAGNLARFEFAGHAVRVDAPLDERRLVSLQGDGRTLEVGRFIRSDLRPVLARELRSALRGA